MNGVELLIIGAAVALILFATYAFKRAREQQAQKIRRKIAEAAARVIEERRMREARKPEIWLTEEVEWWSDLWGADHPEVA